MTTLTAILDDLGGRQGSALAQYAAELAAALVASAPPGCEVAAYLSADTDGGHERALARVPGLAEILSAKQDSRGLARAWAVGLGPRPDGLVHSPSLLAPLARHERGDGTQLVVTVHDLRAFAAPDELPEGVAAWQRQMLKRARRFADAVVVPTHAVAEELLDRVPLGDRVRVIPGAVSPSFAPAADEAQHEQERQRLALPERFVITELGGSPDGLLDVLRAVRLLPEDVALVVGGPAAPEAVARVAGEASVPVQRVHALGPQEQRLLATAYAQARAAVFAPRHDGFGLPLLHAFRSGVPAVHLASPALAETSAGAAVEVTSGPDAPAALAEALLPLLEDSPEREARIVLGRDRETAFSWASAADAVWQLHAEL